MAVGGFNTEILRPPVESDQRATAARETALPRMDAFAAKGGVTNQDAPLPLQLANQGLSQCHIAANCTLGGTDLRRGFVRWDRN